MKNFYIDLGSSTIKVYCYEDELKLIEEHSIYFKNDFDAEKGISESNLKELCDYFEEIKSKYDLKYYNTHIFVTGIFRNLSDLKKYRITKVLMNPPYEKKYKPIDILNAVFDNVPNHTDAAVLLPDHKLEKGPKLKVQRLLKHNRLTKIIKLPKETFSEGVSVSVFIFRTGETTEKHEIFTFKLQNGSESLQLLNQKD